MIVRVTKVTEKRRREDEVTRECTETPLKTGMSGNMSEVGRNERRYEQMSGDERWERRECTFNPKKGTKYANITDEAEKFL